MAPRDGGAPLLGLHAPISGPCNYHIFQYAVTDVDDADVVDKVDVADKKEKRKKKTKLKEI